MKREQKEKEDFLKKNPAAKLYKKPQKNTGESYKSRFARPKNAGVKPVKPPSKPSVIYKYPQSTKNKPSSVYNRPSTSKPPKFSATNNSKPTYENVILAISREVECRIRIYEVDYDNYSAVQIPSAI